MPGAPTYGAGPRYRGRFSGVRLLVLADQDGHDDLVWGRAFTGEAGQRFQGLLAALGITRSYLVLRTLPVDTAGLPDGKVWALADRPDVVALLAAVADRVLDDNPVAAVVTVGPHAERIAGRFELDGQPVVALPRGRRRAHAPRVAGHARLRSLGIPIDQSPTRTAGRRAGADPPGGPSFGLPRWQGTSGDRAVWSTPPQAGPEAARAGLQGAAPRWLDTHRTPYDSDRTTGRQDRMPLDDNGGPGGGQVRARGPDRHDGRPLHRARRRPHLRRRPRHRRGDPAAAPAPTAGTTRPSCAPATRSTRG